MHYRANFNDIELTIEYDVSRLLNFLLVILVLSKRLKL